MSRILKTAIAPHLAQAESGKLRALDSGARKESAVHRDPARHTRERT